MTVRTVCFLINPISGRHSPRVVDGLVRRLSKAFPDAELELTEAPGQAATLARARRQPGNRVVVAVGGDGTVHEVAGGLLGGQAMLAVLPFGSGNDFASTLGAPRGLAQWLDWLPNAPVRRCDVGRIVVRDHQGRRQSAHFVNSLGIGFEADVAAAAARARYLRGFSRYLVAALTQLLRYRPPLMELRWNGLRVRQPQFLVALGNGRRAGGGFLLTPEARLDDGLLDLVRADALSVPRLLSILPAVLRGTHRRYAGVYGDRLRKLRIECPAGCGVHADGEVLATRAVSIAVAVDPGALRLLG